MTMWDDVLLGCVAGFDVADGSIMLKRLEGMIYCFGFSVKVRLAYHISLLQVFQLQVLPPSSQLTSEQ